MTTPDQPPEGVLIESARRQAGLSVREAARRAGISEGWWRQIVKGHQTLSGGGRGDVKGPPRTVAKMAAIVGVSPEQMETEGQRPDAAGEMRHDRPALEVLPGGGDPGRDPLMDLPVLRGFKDEAVRPYLASVREDLARAARDFGAEATPEQIFPAVAEAAAWRQFSPQVAEAIIALMRQAIAQQAGRSPGNTGPGDRTGLGRCGLDDDRA